MEYLLPIAILILLPIFWLLGRRRSRVDDQALTVQLGAVLVADDSVTIQKVVELSFMDRCAKVTAVSNGHEAIRAVEEQSFDLVLADIHMGGISGYEVCERAKAYRPDLPVVLMYGMFEPLDEGKYAQCRADALLKKPFDSKALVALAGKLCVPPAADLS